MVQNFHFYFILKNPYDCCYIGKLYILLSGLGPKTPRRLGLEILVLIGKLAFFDPRKHLTTTSCFWCLVDDFLKYSTQLQAFKKFQENAFLYLNQSTKQLSSVYANCVISTAVVTLANRSIIGAQTTAVGL